MFKSTRDQAAFIALIIVVLFIGGHFLFNLIPFRNTFIREITLAILLFAVTYFTVLFLFNRFIEKRVNPIFKTIQSHTLSQKELRKKISSDDITRSLNQEVEDWAAGKSEEIRKLRQMEKYRKDFLGNVSHELKTPIFNIQGYVLTLLDGGIEDPNINRLYLERTEKSINRMINIVDDLESIARLESGEFKLKMESFNIVKLVEEVFEGQEMQARKMNIRLMFDSGYSKPIKVFADRKRIMEVVGNLVGNSVKYGKKNGRTIVGFTDTGDSVLVDITDDGIGIAEDDLPRIFERFYRVDKSRSRDSGGTGLGLAIVKHIIQAHNQTINVRSKPDKGSSFIFSLKKG
ncbi:MAG: sensor histidine kinase [Bacteroidota bacterium]